MLKLDQRRSDQCRDMVQCSKEWFDLRAKLCFTGSRASCVLGLDRFQTKTKYTLEKLGLIDRKEPDRQSQYYMMWGKIHEKPALKVFTELYKAYCDENEGHHVSEIGLYMYDDDKRFGSSPDAVIHNEDNELIAVVEIKCPTKIYESTRGKQPTIPMSHYIQILCEMACTGAQTGYYVIWTLDETNILSVNGYQEAWDLILPIFRVYCDQYEHYLKLCGELGEDDDKKRKQLVRKIRKEMLLKREFKESLHQELEEIQKKTVRFYNMSVVHRVKFIDK